MTSVMRLAQLVSLAVLNTIVIACSADNSDSGSIDSARAGSAGTGPAPSNAGAGGSPGSSGAGSGNSAGSSAGTAGASGAAGAGGQTVAGPCGAAGILFCETFEAAAVDSTPAGAPWLTGQSCSDANRVVKVTDAVGRDSSKSLVTGNIPYDGCMLAADLGQQSEFWVRSWVRFGAGDASQFSAHEVTVFELAPDASKDDPEIRVGFRGDSSCNPTGVEVNITGGGGGEQTGCTGYKLAADQWYCLELHVVQDATKVTTELYIDEAEQPYTIHGMMKDVVEATGVSVKYLKVGARSYSGQYMPPIYQDDVAVGTQRLRCN